MWPADIITPTTSACATATANNPTSEDPASSLSVQSSNKLTTMKIKIKRNYIRTYVLAAMAEPTPANTKRKVVTNSTIRALMQSGCVASRVVPKAIFAIVKWIPFFCPAAGK
jgi:hypothetical protein